MNNFYTNVFVRGNNLLYRGVHNGKHIKKKIPYKPTLFLPTKNKSEWTTLFGEPLEPVLFSGITDAKDFLKRYDEVTNFKIYGNDRFEYAFIAEEFKGQIDWDIQHLSIAIIDIEVYSGNSFPNPFITKEPITAITLKYLAGETIVFGCGDYKETGEETYIKCNDELELCNKFLCYWKDHCPDVISGWNINGFDIPYIINRFTRILGEDETNKLSPWEHIWKKNTKINGREIITYNIAGVSALDYMELYKWYAPSGKSQESYSLDSIANVELGKSKLSYDEYHSLHELYTQNHQKFIEYNVVDTQIVVDLEEKLKLIELALTLAYETKCNFSDVFAQTRMWDALIYSNLLSKNIIVPPKVYQHKDSAYEGAYVKEPQIGLHKWVASLDINSLYPHLMMQYCISPETIIEPKDYTEAMQKILSDGVTVEKLLSCNVDTSGLVDATVTPNGQFFRTDIQGFLPKMLEEMYDDRKKYKKLMLKSKQDYETETDLTKRPEIEKLIARYTNLQLAKKTILVSAYGTLGSNFFRFYDVRQALGITLAGQLSIRWIENALNVYMNGILKTKGLDYVIASDTDSIFLKLDGIVNKVFTDQSDTTKIIKFMDSVCRDKIQPFIDKSYQELSEYMHAPSQRMAMSRETLSDKMLVVSKKRYILNVHNSEGVQYSTPIVKVVGLEVRKSSTPGLVRGKMTELIALIINTDEQTVQNFIEKFRIEFKKLPGEDISFPRGVNGIKEYGSGAGPLYKLGTPIHVRGAILYNELLGKMGLDKKYPRLQDGDKLKFIYLKTPNPLRDNVISFPGRLPPEFGLHSYVDFNLMFEKVFLDPINLILNCIGWKAKKSNSLEEFFS